MEPWIIAKKEEFKELIGNEPIFVRVKEIVDKGSEYFWVCQYEDRDRKYSYYELKKFEHPELQSKPGVLPVIVRKAIGGSLWVEFSFNKPVEVPLDEAFKDGFEGKTLYLCL